ncbi:MAG: hypothetical protein KAH11_03530 [Rhodospirillales bacterium]|nr:hypothetical protein [Rhodospirillales bacterium]
MADQIRIGDVTPRVRYVADGVTSLFHYPFPIFAPGDLEVYVGGQLKTITTDYAVDGVGKRAGGTAILSETPIAGVSVTLVRRLTVERMSDFTASGEFKADVINAEFDFQAAALQQVNDDLVRSLRLTKTDTTAPLMLPKADARALKTLIFDEDGGAAAATAIDASKGLAVSASTPLADSVGGDAGSASEVSVADHSHPRPLWDDIGIASQAEAEAGSVNTTVMTSLRTGQAMTVLGQPADNTARNMAASALAYVMASYDATAVAGNVGAFFLSDTFQSNSLSVSTNATYDASGDYYHNEDPSPPDMTLAPSPTPLAAANPLDVIGYFVIEPVDTVTFGTDLTGEVSIDGGTAYVTGTWTKVADVGAAGRELYRLDANMSGEAGASLSYRLNSANGKEIRFHECTGLVPLY